MPTYTYVCGARCGERRDVWHLMGDSPNVVCECGSCMRKDPAASFPHVSLKWHRDQGIGEKLVLQSTKRRVANGTTGGIDKSG
jgi:hypothetical protein